MASTAPSSHAASGPALDNRRVAAAAIDLALPALALLALYAGGLLTPAVGLVVLGWTLFYFFALESGGGQTIGKKTLKLRVVDADGHEPSMRQVAMRTVVRVVDLPVIGLIAMMASGDKRLRLGDMAAETHVTEADSFAGKSDFAADTARLAPIVPAAFDEPVKDKPKRSRPSLGGPELKLPKLSRSRKANPPKPAKSGRRTLGGPEIKLPKFGRGQSKASPPPAADPEPFAVPGAPAPSGPPQVAVPDAVEAFGLYDETLPQPEVEVVSESVNESVDGPAEDDVAATVDEPDVQVTPQPQASPPPPLQPPAIPALPVEESPPPRPPAIPAALDPERRAPDHDPAQPEDSDGPTIEVKPIETVSAMDLIMQDAGDRRPDR